MKEGKILLTPVKNVGSKEVGYGLTETLEIIDFFVAIKTAYEKANADGKINWADLPYLIEPAKKLLPAFRGIEFVPKELDNIDFAEAEVIVKEVQTRFGITDIEAKQLIEHGFKAAFHIKQIVDLYPQVF